jgi:hypothetical protein
MTLRGTWSWSPSRSLGRRWSLRRAGLNAMTARTSQAAFAAGHRMAGGQCRVLEGSVDLLDDRVPPVGAVRGDRVEVVAVGALLASCPARDAAPGAQDVALVGLAEPVIADRLFTGRSARIGVLAMQPVQRHPTRLPMSQLPVRADEHALVLSHPGSNRAYTSRSGQPETSFQATPAPSAASSTAVMLIRDIAREVAIARPDKPSA